MDLIVKDKNLIGISRQTIPYLSQLAFSVLYANPTTIDIYGNFIQIKGSGLEILVSENMKQILRKLGCK